MSLFPIETKIIDYAEKISIYSKKDNKREIPKKGIDSKTKKREVEMKINLGLS